MNIIEKLDDLIYQATEERSHYYTAGVLKEAKFNLERERQWCKESEETATRLEASLAESERALGEALGALGKINQKARLYAKGHGEKFNIELLIDIDCYSEAILNEPEPPGSPNEPRPGREYLGSIMQAHLPARTNAYPAIDHTQTDYSHPKPERTEPGTGAAGGFAMD